MMKFVYSNNTSNNFATLLSFVLAVSLTGSSYAGTSPYAEIVILNGQVITADSNDPEQVTIAEAIAIQGNKIMEVGSNDEIRALVADWTEVIDARGNSVTPGYIDTHNHIYESATGFPWVVNSIPDLLELRVSAQTPEELTEITIRAIETRAQQVPEGKWIRVGIGPPPVSVPAM
ncbi:MAG: hypothetical protein GTO60_04780, partial [Gammaproteobacteria bacterium]|nr:hypothetical protein [Gammaproteobacteria bacterium]NIO62184.1 hypothetical protein [Gammaproteobacteria bacterium]